MKLENKFLNQETTNNKHNQNPTIPLPKSFIPRESISPNNEVKKEELGSSLFKIDLNEELTPINPNLKENDSLPTTELNDIDIPLAPVSSSTGHTLNNDTNDNSIINSLPDEDLVELPNQSNFPPAYLEKTKNKHVKLESNKNILNSNNTKIEDKIVNHSSNMIVRPTNSTSIINKSDSKSKVSRELNKQPLSDLYKFKAMKNNTIFNMNKNNLNDHLNKKTTDEIINKVHHKMPYHENKSINNINTLNNINNLNLIKVESKEEIQMEKQNKEKEKLKNSLVNYYLNRKKLEELEKIKLKNSLPLFKKNDFAR